MTTFKFTEQAEHEQGFAQIFDERIVPILRAHERTRKEYRKKAMMGMGAGGTFGVGSVGGGVAMESEFALFGGAFGGAVAWGAKKYFENKWRAGLGGEVLPILCEFLGEMEYGKQGIELSKFSRLGLIPSYDEATREDPVSGEHDGLGWSMTEARLRTKSRDSKGNTRTSTVFRGLLFRIDIKGPAPRIFFGRDRGGALNWLSETFSASRKGMEKVQIDDPDFERIYETYSDSPGAAQRFIDANLTAGLLEIARSEAGKSYIACGMEGDGLYLALPRKGDFLGLGSLFRPLHTVDADLHEALSDLSMPARVIDRLRGV